MELQISNRKNNIKMTIIVALVGFGVAFLSAPFILNTVYGTLPNEYSQVLEIAQNNSEQYEGLMIDNYIELIKPDICGTLENQTEIKQCMMI